MPNPIKSRIRHLAKAVTWRLIASATTFSLALFFFQPETEFIDIDTTEKSVEASLDELLAILP